jgi:hypothetical protein
VSDSVGDENECRLVYRGAVPSVRGKCYIECDVPQMRRRDAVRDHIRELRGVPMAGWRVMVVSAADEVSPAIFP